MINFQSIPKRKVFARIFYAVAIISIVYRYCSHMLLSQLENPVLTFVNTDITYIYFAFSGMGEFLTHHHKAGLAFDICFLLVTVSALLFPEKRFLPIAFTLLLGVYELTGYTYLCFHKHNLTGLFVCSLMFWVTDERGFIPLFNLTRYYCLFVYGSAGFWKFFRGIWNLKGHFPVILKNDAMAYMVEHSTGLRVQVISWLVIHPGILDYIMIATCFIQFSFFIGLFTRRLDWFFFLFAVSFHILAYYLVYASFFEFSIILITLLPAAFLYKKPANI
jgi:hypothetical protein